MPQMQIFAWKKRMQFGKRMWTAGRGELYAIIYEHLEDGQSYYQWKISERGSTMTRPRAHQDYPKSLRGAKEACYRYARKYRARIAAEAEAFGYVVTDPTTTGESP